MTWKKAAMIDGRLSPVDDAAEPTSLLGKRRITCQQQFADMKAARPVG